MKRRFSSKQYAERLRRQRRRLYLQDGVLSVRFIKFINEPKPAPVLLPVSDHTTAIVLPEPTAGLICSACGHRYVDPQTWVCGACGADHNEHLPKAHVQPPYDDHCRWCGCPTSVGDYCEICGVFNGFRTDPVESAEEWAASLDMPSPPWPGGAA